MKHSDDIISTKIINTTIGIGHDTRTRVVTNKNNQHTNHNTTATENKTKVVMDVVFNAQNAIGQAFDAKIVYINLTKLPSLKVSDEMRQLISTLKSGDILSLSIEYNPDQPNIIPSTVIGVDNESHTILKTPFGILHAAVDIGIESEAEILITIHCNPVQEVAFKREHVKHALSKFYAMLSSHKNDLLSLTDAILAQENLWGYRKLSSTLITKSNARISNNILRRTRNVGAEHVEQWIDNEIVAPITESRMQHAIKLIEKVALEIQEYSTQRQDPERWNVILIPMFEEQNRHQYKMFVRGQNAPGHFTRFVINAAIDVELIQVDGLIHFSSHGSNVTHIDRLNIIIRAQKVLPEDIARNITKTFLAHQRITGIEGMLNFDVASHFPVDPTSEMIDSMEEQTNTHIVETKT